MIGLFVIFLQTQLLAATTAPGCQDLSRILSEAEKELQTSHAPACGELNITTLLPQEISSETESFFNEHKCSPLYQIEIKIAELENQEALLLGFEKLKNEVSSSQEEISTEKNQERINQATKDFAQALNTAQSIEVMLDSEIPGKDVNFLQLLAAESPDLWSDVEKLRSLTNEFCEKITDAKKLRVCSSDFAPNEQTHKELKELLRTGSLSKEEADQWKNSLSIQKADGSRYSFVTMTDAISESYTKLLKGETLSEHELASLKALDKFRSNPQLSFAKNLPAPKGNNLVQAKIKNHINSLIKRQEVEINTKMSVVSAVNKELMNNNEQAACALVNVLTDVDTTCMSALKSTLARQKESSANDQTNQLNEALSSFTKSQNYLAKLKELSGKCDSNLNECALHIPLDLAQMSNELSALRMIKEKVGSAQVNNMAFRNFALSKWTQNCNDSIDSQKSIVEECQDTLSSMAPEMYKLSSSLMDISLLIDPKKVSSEDGTVKALCENEEVKKRTDQQKLCAFFTDVVSDELPADEKKVDQDTYQASVSAPKGSNKSREAWLKGLSLIANTATDSWLAGNNQGSYWGNAVNPYAYNFGPYDMTQAMGTADAILFNARYYGAYGFYMPTQGLQPYTTFGASSISSYQALPGTSGAYSYFSK